MRVAIVHEWLINFRGSERVLLELSRIFPKAVIYASVLDRASLPPELANRDIRTTFIQKLPFATKWYQKYLPFMPRAYEELDMSDYDLIISSSHSCAKGIIPAPNALHVCYCYTPMRYAWSGFHEYRNSLEFKPLKWVMGVLMHRLRQWDLSTVSRVDHFIACSREVQQRIQRYYKRNSTVVFPPVSIKSNNNEVTTTSRVVDLINKLTETSFYLSLGRLVPYKRVDIAVDVCTRLNRTLVVAGDGPELEQLKKRAGPTIYFIEDFTDQEASLLYSACSAFLFPGAEDFGITVVESQLNGKPVIAFGKGGVEDTVIPETGILFEEQSINSLSEAIIEFEKRKFDSELIVSHANQFSSKAFQEKIVKLIESLQEERMLRF